MVENSSTEMEELSYYSESEKILDILSEKLPIVEETLTSSINILQEIAEEDNEKIDSRIDFIEAFKEIIEIYDLTSNKKIYIEILISSYYKKMLDIRK